MNKFTHKLIHVINSPLSLAVTKVSQDLMWPPLGAISVASAVERETDWKVRCMDGEDVGIDTVKKRIKAEKPQVVALSTLTQSYEPALEIASLAKSYGGKVLLGNDHAALWADNIMRKQPTVDYISTSEFGELTIADFLNHIEGKMSAEEVPGLIFRDGQGRVRKSIVEERPVKGRTGMDQLGIPNRALLDASSWRSYTDRYIETYGYFMDIDVTGVATINRARGCARKNNRCIYCGIHDLTMRLSSWELFWEDVQAARQDVNANVIYEVFDSLSSAPEWLRGIVATKPKDARDLRFFVYSQAKDITKKTVALFEQLGVVVVNVGMDSGDTRMLKILKGKMDSVEKNINAATLLSEAGMKVYASFVLGGPGETRESLDNTKRFAKWLVDERIAAGIEAQPLIPMVGSRVGKMLTDLDEVERVVAETGCPVNDYEKLMSLHEQWLDADFIETADVTEDYHAIFSSVPHRELIDVALEMTNYAASQGIGFGNLGGEKFGWM